MSAPVDPWRSASPQAPRRQRRPDRPARRAPTFAGRIARRRSVLPALAELLARIRCCERLLPGLADHSPFLWRLASADPAAALAARWQPLPNDALGRDRSRDRGERRRRAAAANADVMRRLRRAKQELALLVALADLGGRVDASSGDGGADRLRRCGRGERRALAAPPGGRSRQAHAQSMRRIRRDGLRPRRAGARQAWRARAELLLRHRPRRLLRPRAAAARATVSRPAPFFVRLVKGHREAPAGAHAGRLCLPRSTCACGPTPASTPIAISLPSAFAYYETVGQNWERAAMIKARPVAGDLRARRGFPRASSRPSSGANISTSPPSPTSTR